MHKAPAFQLKSQGITIVSVVTFYFGRRSYEKALDEKEFEYGEATRECRTVRREELEMELNDLDNSSFDEMMNYEGEYYSGNYYRIPHKKREYDW